MSDRRSGMQTVLVTGGGGFIGSNLVRLLLRTGVGRVTVLDNFCSGHRANVDDLDIRLIEADVTEHGAVDEAIRGCDTVFHLAASVGNARSIADPIVDATTNVLGTLTVLEAARRQGVGKVVYLVFSRGVWRVEDTPDPRGSSAGARYALWLHQARRREAVPELRQALSDVLRVPAIFQCYGVWLR